VPEVRHVVVEAGWNGEPRQVMLLLELDPAALGDVHRVGHQLRPVGEQLRHLVRRLEVRLLPVEGEAVGIALQDPRADAEKRVVHVGVFAPQVMGVIGDHYGEAQLIGQLEDARVDLVLTLDAVVLHLEKVAVREGAGVEVGRRFRVFVAPELEVLRDLPRQAGAEHDHSLAVLREDLVIEAGLPVEALRVTTRRETHEVAVSREVAGQEHQVRVLGRCVLGALLLPPIAVGHVGLEPDDRLDALLLRLLLELPGAVQIAVVGDGQGRHAQLHAAADQIVDPIGPVEERVLAVAVQVNERHVAVRRFLPWTWNILHLQYNMLT